MNKLRYFAVHQMAILATAFGIVGAVAAQVPGDGSRMPETPITVPTFASVLRLYPGVAPGSEDAVHAERWEQQGNDRRVRNVTVPELIPVLPAADTANGTAVIVLPGGAFRRLAMDKEGLRVAALLAQQGVTAFVLKYRLVETPASLAEMESAMRTQIASGKVISTFPLAIEDGRRAMQLVRENAARWGVRRDRIGMIGFSAGAMTTLQVVLGGDAASRPDFAGIIYGPMGDVAVPEDAPPLFVALAADDPLFGKGDFGLVSAWKKAGKAVELHFYERGGHGFGMSTQGSTSDLWADQFVAWLRMRRFVGK